MLKRDRVAEIPIYEIHYLLLVYIVKKGILFVTPNVRDEQNQYGLLVHNAEKRQGS